MFLPELDIPTRLSVVINTYVYIKACIVILLRELSVLREFR